MQIKRGVKYLTVLLAAVCLRSPAQYFDDDARLRLNIYLIKKTGKMEYQLLLQNRFHNNMRVYHPNVAAGFSYKFNKHVRTMGGYAFTADREMEGYYTQVHQLYAGISFKQKIKKFTFVYRNLVQSQVKRPLTGRELLVPITFDRNKLTVKYEINKRWEVFCSGEIYLTFSNRQLFDPIARSRNSLGLSYKISKSLELSPYFLYQKKYDYRNTAARHFIYGLTLQKEF